MAAIYSTSFAHVSLTPSVNNTLFTCPAGYVAVLRDIDAFCESAGTQTVFFFFTAPGLPFTGLEFASANSWAQWRGRQVFGVGQELVASPSAGTIVVKISGYLLSV